MKQEKKILTVDKKGPRGRRIPKIFSPKETADRQIQPEAGIGQREAPSD